MKWKTVLVTAVIVLLIVALGLMAMRVLVPQEVRDIEDRIERYELIKEEQQLITEILTFRYEAALIKAKFNPTQPEAPQQVPPK